MQILKLKSSPKMNSPKKTKKVTSGSHLIAFISLSLGFSGLLFGASAWNVWSTYQAFDKAISNQFKLQNLSNQIIYYDEVLTMSARMYAGTGDSKWESRYNQFVSQLEITIKQIIEQTPNTYNANAKKTDEANLKLVDLETKSFDLVRQGKAQEAMQILSGTEYESLKQIYADGILTTRNAILMETENSLDRYRQFLFQSLLLTGLSFPILLVTATIIIFRVKGFVKERSLAQLSLQQLNQQLESRVEQRTQDLKSANSEITYLNERLQEENLRMSSELDVTRRLQQMMLPLDEELETIKELDISGFMEPSNEVGGDYYDVLHHYGRVKIGIGDVTGHGLESGVLMIMAQTAVLTMSVLQEKDPIRVLKALNTVLYENVTRMNSDKNMTLLLIDYFKGQLSLVGQHEEVIVVRADGTVERIDTNDLGFPLGLEADISSFIMQAEINLNPEDIVVLYTDGITEAENPNRQFYGLERLCQLVQNHRQESAQLICEAIIQNLKNFIGLSRVYDDITLLVIKQLQY
jgi:serine phosphatase RsbU (regulator of sigma subunit)